jgi:hypothetical protein
MANENGRYDTTKIVHNRHNSEEITSNLKLLSLRPAVYILMLKAVIFNACRIVTMAEQ